MSSEVANTPNTPAEASSSKSAKRKGGKSSKQKGSKSSKQKDSRSAKREGPIPVTLLSGFLGSGKTTLLKHILTSDHGLRIAVIVNDIGEVNIDANLITQTYSLTQSEDKVTTVALQNGCICCTLRGDLLEELVRLSELQEFDYIVIESSGISEPEQVAETFDAELSNQLNAIAESPEGFGLDENMVKVLRKVADRGGVEKFAKLDTTVTVIDAFTMFNDFETADLLSGRRDDVPSEDDRTVSDLMVDQIEFADVIVLNKVGMVDARSLQTIVGLIEKLNSSAKIIQTNYSRVDVAELLNTGKFNLEAAKVGYGWLKDLHEMTMREVNGRTVITPTPETEEYNVRNFIYRRWRPFHPERLWRLIYDKFILQMAVLDEDEDEDEEEDNDDEDKKMADSDEDDEWEGCSDADEEGDASMHDADADSDSTAPTTPEGDHDSKSDGEEDGLVPPDDQTILANKRANPLFARLFRSKGEFFLATRPQQAGAWSQAGAMLTLEESRPWFAARPDVYDLDNSAFRDLIDNDTRGEWGDRRQEIVFIGENLDIPGITEALDACLLNDKEYAQWEKIMRKNISQEKKEDKLTDIFPDGFPGWGGDEEDEEPWHEGHHHSRSSQIVEVD